jgi:catechol 2,3-dioxygenase-like lactoylglutathione lyase family enzyme
MRTILAYRSPQRTSIFKHETRGQREPAPPSQRRARRVCARRPSRRKPTTITLNHTIVSAHDKDAAARFFAQIFGLRFEGLDGHFAPVRVNDTLTLDFADAKRTIASQHYAFQVSDAEFDAILQRVKDAGLAFGSGPRSLEDGKLNDWNGGRGFYYKDHDGHVIELMTKPQ